MSLDPDLLISRLSHRPARLLEAMITVDGSSKPPQSVLADQIRPDHSSSLGILDHLPQEILAMILGALDIKSIACFARVSLRAHSLVQSEPAYRDLATVAPHVLLALGATGLLGTHSLANLHDALRTERCAHCIYYGPFLFLPTCERCCWNCLRYNTSLWVLSPADAENYFCLSKQHLEQLPSINIIPGTYGTPGRLVTERGKLFTVKAARTLGLAVHGFAETMMRAMVRRCKIVQLVEKGRYLQSHSNGLSNHDPLLVLTQKNVPSNDCFGMASIPFPSLSKTGTIEEGLWCCGCELTRNLHYSSKLPQTELERIVPSNCRPRRVLFGLERRAHSKKSFFEHIKHCYGARQLAPELAVESVETL